MNTFTKALSGVLLAFLLTMPVFAQDTEFPPTQEAPTAEATVEPVPVEPAPEEPIELVQQFDFSQLLNLILLAIVLIQSAMIHGSIQASQWQEFVKAGSVVATNTASELDDKAFALAKQITPYLLKLGVLTNPDAPTAQSVSPFTTNISGGTDTVIQTTTTTTVDNDNVGLAG